MKKKYYNEAVIGNEKIVASFSYQGEMLRLFYPTRDYRQFIDTMYTGVKINDSSFICLQEDINNQYEQYYTENTNILNTKIKNTYFNLSILQTDFVSIEKNVIIKKYKMTNENTIDLEVDFLLYSKLLSDSNNMVGSKIEQDILLQYSHDNTYCIFSKLPILGYRLNHSEEEIKSGILQDKDYIGMANDSAISYKIGNLKPGESKEFEIFIYLNDHQEKYQFDDIIEEINQIKKMDTTKELKKVEKYWNHYVKEHDGLKVLSKKEEWKKKLIGTEEMSNEIDKMACEKYENMKQIYVRSILLFPLLSNTETGGISAALEIDEDRSQCGRYSYCWPRDAVFVTKALDLLNMTEQTTKFYTNFCKKTQSKNGMWEQRFYTDGRLAPCWGYQIDETASILYGIYEHYKMTKDKEFLKQVYPMCQKANVSLGTFSKETFNKQVSNNINNKQESYDLWEMHEGIHLYSLSAIYAALEAMIAMKQELNETKEIEILEEKAEKIKHYCIENFCDKESKTLKRSNKDNIVDISLLGTVVPFSMLDADQKEVKNTIEKINMTLRTYTGGYLRFENDSYLGGNNPWPIATLWMALYNMKIGNKEEARKQIELITKTATKHGFLAEQIDNETMQSKWVIGLGWSHAMYIIALSCLFRDVF